MNSLVKTISCLGNMIRKTSYKPVEPAWKKWNLPPPYHGDFRPDLYQDVDPIFNIHLQMYRKWTDSVRVKMPSRQLAIESNKKYIPQIHQIVEKWKNEMAVTMNNQATFELMLKDLSYEIFVAENRHRYQTEQKLRHYASLKKFSRNVDLDKFVNSYNEFIWDNINTSHNYLSPKIEANYRRNYHDGEVSPVTSLVFYLYFKTGRVHRFLAGLLSAAYRNPFKLRQKAII